MSVQRVLLALPAEANLLRESLRQRLEMEPNLEVVGEVFSDIDLLVAVGQTAANVVIHNWCGSGDAPAVHSHLFEEYPSLKVVGLTESMDQGFLFQRPIVVSPVRSELNDLISFISRGADLPEEDSL